jgi:hypothetical protein
MLGFLAYSEGWKKIIDDRIKRDYTGRGLG